MTTKARWVVGIAMVVAVVGVGVGFAAAGDEGTSQVAGGMMAGSGGMMGPAPMGSGTMGAGMATMMAGVDVDAMHDQMTAAMAGKVLPDVLARCDALHDQAWLGAIGANGSGHAAHHGNVGSTG
jgi:hypothetical protein